MMLSQDAAPVSAPAAPALQISLACILSLPRDESVLACGPSLCLGINTSHIGPSIHPGHKNLLTVSQGWAWVWLILSGIKWN